MKKNSLNLYLILFIAFELSYYLLIAQTGIVEYFNSDIKQILLLPIGGLIGTFLSGLVSLNIKLKANIALGVQLFTSLFYPDFNMIGLFLIGLSVGAMAPIVIYVLKSAKLKELALALVISYVSSTLLFNFPSEQRLVIALLASITPLVTLQFIKLKVEEKTNGFKDFEYKTIMMFLLWIFLDSTLFETISRNSEISIWRGGYTFEIALFHVIGVFAGILQKYDEYKNEMIVISLFALSYLFFFLNEAFVLSVIYPFVISYYNVVILRALVKIKDFRLLSFSMLFIGWGASGLGLMVALNSFIIYVPIIFVLFIVLFIYKNHNQKKELYYV